MAYITIKTAIQVMLETNDSSVLAKTDPAKRSELLQALAIVQGRLQKSNMGQGTTTQRIKPPQGQDRPHMPASGQSYASMQKAKHYDIKTGRKLADLPSEPTPRKGLPVAERGERRASKIISSDSIRTPKLNPNREDHPVESYDDAPLRKRYEEPVEWIAGSSYMQQDDAPPTTYRGLSKETE
jgi:hypothetical protein